MMANIYNSVIFSMAQDKTCHRECEPFVRYFSADGSRGMSVFKDYDREAASFVLI